MMRPSASAAFTSSTREPAGAVAPIEPGAAALQPDVGMRGESIRKGRRTMAKTTINRTAKPSGTKKGGKTAPRKTAATPAPQAKRTAMRPTGSKTSRA